MQGKLGEESGGAVDLKTLFRSSKRGVKVFFSVSELFGYHMRRCSVSFRRIS